mmetsp:Transcript_13962/g.11935  ORF Transcript_13962/g.11935 Transcript_13962/m.11935 type:complete len:319 (-) Transcript_13962:243-1199(-)
MPHVKLQTVAAIAGPNEKYDTLQPSDRDIKVLNRISKSKFPVYLAKDTLNNKQYAMKVFNYKDEKPNTSFTNEIRFRELTHKNVINIASTLEKRSAVTAEANMTVSYILYELAPFGDFLQLMKAIRGPMEEKLARTYFHQLVNGLEYLHKNGCAHLDLKLQNLLLGEDYNLKIADFDLSYKKGDKHLISHGSKNCRAPELRNSTIKNPYTADLYSVGIIMFNIVVGHMPCCEDGPVNGHDFEELMSTDKAQFWDLHQSMTAGTHIASGFKDLFDGLTQRNPSERYGITDIKRSEWFRGETYTQAQVKEIVSKFVKRTN